jgi:hypothetical protein
VRDVWSPVYVNALLLRDRSSGGDGDLTEERLYFTSDANYDVKSVISTAGAVEEHVLYTAYGIATFTNSSWSSSADTLAVRTGWQGGESMSWINGWSFQNRIELANLNVWMTAEPSLGSYVDGMNLYESDGDNPIGRRDPMGTGTGVPFGPTGSNFSRNDPVDLSREAEARAAAMARKAPCATALWSGYAEVNNYVWMFGGEATLHIHAEGRDTTGHLYVIDMTGEGEPADGNAAWGVGALHFKSTFTDISAPSQWPVDKGSKVSVVAIGIMLLPIFPGATLVRLSRVNWEFGGLKWSSWNYFSGKAYWEGAAGVGGTIDTVNNKISPQ